jgi:hypothetical protein
MASAESPSATATRPSRIVEMALICGYTPSLTCE